MQFLKIYIVVKYIGAECTRSATVFFFKIVVSYNNPIPVSLLTNLGAILLEQL